jgi:hypothetical protein
MRVGENILAELQGVPDRYTRDQTVRFVCKKDTLHPIDSDAKELPFRKSGCGQKFLKTIPGTQVAGRCPHCSAYVMEDGAEFYHWRSGIPTGRMVGNWRPYQRERQRESPMHYVADLRVIAHVKFADMQKENSVGVIFQEGTQKGARSISVRLTAGEGKINGISIIEKTPKGETIEKEFPVDITPKISEHKEGFNITIQRLDGQILVYLENSSEAQARYILSDEAKPDMRASYRSTGLSLAVYSGVAEWDEVKIDRDVHYYSGLEEEARGFSDALSPLMWDKGQMEIPENEFLFLGDNAPESLDGRIFGSVSRNLLYGPAELMWWPPPRVHMLP